MKYVKCINNGGGANYMLTLGKRYKVFHEDSERYRIMYDGGNDTHDFYKRRFIDDPLTINKRTKIL